MLHCLEQNVRGDGDEGSVKRGSCSLTVVGSYQKQIVRHRILAGLVTSRFPILALF